MSVYIKGMEMPTSCSVCELCGCYKESKGDVHRCDITMYVVDYEVGLEKRRDNCPLIPVPDHGRLIDADALPWMVGEDELGNPAYLLIKKCVDVIPTVIPADPAKEE